MPWAWVCGCPVESGDSPGLPTHIFIKPYTHSRPRKTTFCNNRDPNGAALCAAPSVAPLRRARNETSCYASPSPTLCPALPTRQTCNDPSIAVQTQQCLCLAPSS
eukprot:7373253-Prymnesium_polylepis.1